MSAGLSQWFRRFATIGGCSVSLMGILVLLGWALNVVTLESVFPGWPKMAALTAVTFVFAGLGLWAVAGEAVLGRVARTRQYILRRLSQSCAVLVVFIGLVRLCGYRVGWNGNMDQLWFRQSSTADPAQMAPATAFSFVVLGCALLLAGRSRLVRGFQFLTLLGGLIGWLGFSHYLYGGERLLPYAQMAVHAAMGFLVLSAGVFCARTDGALMELVVSENAAGMIVRRLAPAGLAVPVILGWLRLKAQRAGWFGTEAGVSLFALANTLVFSVLIWINVKLLHRTDKERKNVEQALRESEERTHAIVDTAPDGVITMDHQGRIAEFNPAAERIFGYRRREVIGQRLADVIIPSELREQHRRGLARYLETGEAAASGKRIEITGMRADGSRVAVELSINRMPGAGPPMFAGFVRDITERKHERPVSPNSRSSLSRPTMQLSVRLWMALSPAGTVGRKSCSAIPPPRFSANRC